MEAVLEHLRALGPEVVGGFVGYWLHTLQHGVFKRIRLRVFAAVFRR
jgi:hypothetical protein